MRQREMLDATGRFHGDVEVMRPDGVLLVLEVVAVADVAPGLHVLTARDVTDRVRAEQRLRTALRAEQQVAEELRRLADLKNGFLQAVSHELRTPLTAVLGFSVLLRERRELLADRGDELLERLEANARRLDRMLADLLDVDRLTRGIIEPHRTTTNLVALVRRTVDDLGPSRDRVRVHGAGVVGQLDPARVERIVENLVANAIKHSDGESPVDVSCRRTPDGCEVAVADRGPGIPDDLKQAVFEPFRQGDTPASRVGGAGIGLTVVATFAALHGGTVRVEDRPGGGAVFVVTLPDEAPPTCAQDAQEPAPRTAHVASRVPSLQDGGWPVEVTDEAAVPKRE